MCLSLGSGNFTLIAYKTQALVVRPIQWFPSILYCPLWKFQRWLMEQDVNLCRWLSLSALQSEVRSVSATPGKSLRPALTAGSPPRARAIHAIIKIHKYASICMHICTVSKQIAVNIKCYSHAHVYDFFFFFCTCIHVFSFNYPHIDSTRGRDAATYTLVRAMISLQNVNGHCRGHLK